MNDRHETPDPLSPFGPEDLDGHTIEELGDYLDAGRTPPDPSIDDSPGCQLALDALERLRTATSDLIAADTAAEPEPDETWVQKILSGIVLDARAGRRIPLLPPARNVDLGVTEGAVRGLVRAVENTVPGVVIGRCRLDGDVTAPGAPVRVEVEASIRYGLPFADLAHDLRTQVADRLREHTDLAVVAVDIAIIDVQAAPQRKGATE